MRKLTVKRKWSIIECASRVSLYVECAEGATHKIDGKAFKEYPLKNGKSVEVEIPDGETEVIVASSTASTSRIIPDGNEDVALTAKPRYNPAQGNPFDVE